MSGTIEIEIDETGNSSVSVKGVSGKSCKDLTAELEKALGKEVDCKKSSEWSKPAQQQRKAQQ